MNKSPKKKPGDAKTQAIEGIRKIKIADLRFDDRNANQGTELGKELLQTSISKYGVGRGVLADKNLKLIAGNHAVKEMMEQGVENVIVIPTDGKTLVVTQRIDIDKDSKEGHGLALADNRVTQANLQFDMEVIRELEAEFDLELDELGINIQEEGPYFPGHQPIEGSDQMETSYGEKSSTGYSSETKEFEQTYFPVAVTLTKAERLAFDKWKKENEARTDTEAFCLLFKKANNV